MSLKEYLYLIILYNLYHILFLPKSPRSSPTLYPPNFIFSLYLKQQKCKNKKSKQNPNKTNKQTKLKDNKIKK